MQRYQLAAGVAMAGVLAFQLSVQAAEKFQKLSGAQIRAKLSGMEITDEAHWADVFAPNGTLTSYSMSRKSTGKWRVQKDELCIDRGNDDGSCYQVWLSGKKNRAPARGFKPAIRGSAPEAERSAEIVWWDAS
jgi:hypothetical protein